MDTRPRYSGCRLRNVGRRLPFVFACCACRIHQRPASVPILRRACCACWGAHTNFTLDDGTAVGQLKIIMAGTEPASSYEANSSNRQTKPDLLVATKGKTNRRCSPLECLRWHSTRRFLRRMGQLLPVDS